MAMHVFVLGKERYQNEQGHWRQRIRYGLELVPTQRRGNIGRRGEPGRRCFPPLPDGSYYHATKGWRGRRKGR